MNGNEFYKSKIPFIHFVNSIFGIIGYGFTNVMRLNPIKVYVYIYTIVNLQTYNFKSSILKAKIH